jgi:hypothetical protein
MIGEWQALYKGFGLAKFRNFSHSDLIDSQTGVKDIPINSVLFLMIEV